MNNKTQIYAIFQLCQVRTKKNELIEVSKNVQIK